MLDNFCQETMAVLGTRIRKCLTFCAMPKKSDIFWFLCPKPPWSLGKNCQTYRWNLMRRALLLQALGFSARNIWSMTLLYILLASRHAKSQWQIYTYFNPPLSTEAIRLKCGRCKRSAPYFNCHDKFFDFVIRTYLNLLLYVSVIFPLEVD